MILAICILLGSVRGLPVDVDTIEVNHTPRFTQVILWRWSYDYNRNDCIDYWISNQIEDMPTQRRGAWHASHGKKQYRSRQMVESWTANDPERDNAKLFPQSWRCEQ